MQGKKLELTNQRFRKALVLSEAGRTHRGATRWECLCDCGNIFFTDGSSLRSGDVQSCGCWKQEASRTHGLYKTPEYAIWLGMRRRCLSPGSQFYHHYGARGITICERWSDFGNFYADMGPRPSRKHSLDRINNNGNYEPGNVRWATQARQMRNTRVTRMLTLDGRTMALSDWADELGINKNTLRNRLWSGWSEERALRS